MQPPEFNPHDYIDCDELLTRAKLAWLWECLRTKTIPDTWADYLSGVVTYKFNRTYVLLRNEHRLLAVYRLRPYGELRRLKRWSENLEKILDQSQDFYEEKYEHNK
jgi:hypothetical protein